MSALGKVIYGMNFSLEDDYHQCLKNKMSLLLVGKDKSVKIALEEIDDEDYDFIIKTTNIGNIKSVELYAEEPKLARWLEDTITITDFKKGKKYKLTPSKTKIELKPNFQEFVLITDQVTGESIAKKVESPIKLQKSSKGSGKGCLSVFVPVVVVLVAVALFAPDLLKEFSEKHKYQSVDKFVKKMEEMKNLFPNQYTFNWNVLRNAGKRHLEKVHSGSIEDLSPASFLVVSYKESSEILECFMKHLGESYTSKEFEIIECEEYAGKDNARLSLDMRIKESLKYTQKFAVVKNIEKLSFDAAQLFMTYSDAYNDLATYPQSTIILTASLPFNSKEDRKQDERTVASYFKDTIWKGQATIDSIAALWTRVGDGIIVLKEEKTNPCA